MATLNISLPDEMRQWIDSQVSSGRYANASDYVRDLIRENLSRNELIKLALIEGEQSGESAVNIQDIIKSENQSLSSK
jgi:antitoxin ParD1/3/4